AEDGIRDATVTGVQTCALPISIALAWDRPTSASSAGQLRFVLERQYGYPVTVIRTQQLAGADLSKFQVLILPEGGFGEGYGAVRSEERRVGKEWGVGGRLVAWV